MSGYSLMLAAETAFLVAWASPCAAQTPEWRDSSSHAVRRISTAPSVYLEVVDWGGAGRTIVFCSGLGDTAHTFDAFAPPFTDSFRVVAITRRGFGASSRPEGGYDSATRASDIASVLDSLGVREAILVGHSIGGEEISRFAIAYPDRVLALVFLDAYSREPIPGFEIETAPPRPPQATLPRMTSTDSASIQGLMAYWARRFGYTPLEAEVRAVTQFAADGRVAMFPAPSAATAVSAGTGGIVYTQISVPVLAVFATHPLVQQLFPGYEMFDATNQRFAEIYAAAVYRFELAQMERLRTQVRRNQILELAGANHYVYYSHSTVVEAAMREFLGSLERER